ncbi:unnamed protein product [Trichogramma brassicae]|uniref:FAD dependent oxidoreductase domain-containing protein n=1 Tax=Trichogramma brassicae TaxID=86971 RepID=A0A6H5IR58_9HYME|nr:unnamed protein product [Trichogramma brassicae]
MKIAVLGAGCVGVTTALELQRELPQAQISLLAADFEGIKSFVAAGIFRIGTSFAGPSETITRQWIKDSYDYYEELSRSRDASEIGVAGISGYMFSNESPEVVMNDYMEKLVPIYRRATESELQLTDNVWKYGSFVSTLIDLFKLITKQTISQSINILIAATIQWEPPYSTALFVLFECGSLFI